MKVWTDCLARHKWCAKSLKHQLWKYRLLQWLHAESQMLCLCYYVEQPSGQPQGQQSCPSTLFACWITPKASSGENLLIFLDSNGNLQRTLSIDANICMQPSAILFAISVTSSREKKKIAWRLFLEGALRSFLRGLKMFTVLRAKGISGNLSLGYRQKI